MGKIYATRYRDESTVIDSRTSIAASSNVTVQDLIKSEAQFETALGSKNQLTVDAELIFENLESQRITGGEKDVTTDSFLFQNEFRPMANLALVLGGRFDYHSEFGTHLNPKLSGLGRVYLAGVNFSISMSARHLLKGLKSNFRPVPSGASPRQSAMRISTAKTRRRV